MGPTNTSLFEKSYKILTNYLPSIVMEISTSYDFFWKRSLCYWKVGQRMTNNYALLNKHKRKRLFKIFLARIDYIISWFLTASWLQTIFEHTHIITSRRNNIEMLVKGMSSIPFWLDFHVQQSEKLALIYLLGKIEIL